MWGGEAERGRSGSPTISSGRVWATEGTPPVASIPSTDPNNREDTRQISTTSADELHDC